MWQQEELLERSFEEYIGCVHDVLRIAGEMLQSPPETPTEFEVKLGAIPARNMVDPAEPVFDIVSIGVPCVEDRTAAAAFIRKDESPVSRLGHIGRQPAGS